MWQKFLFWYMIWKYKRLAGYTKVPTKVIYAQAWHETGGFKSKIFRENKNLFGMRQAKKRKNLATGELHSHATYRGYKDSIRDYFLRQKNFGIPNVGESEYIERTVNSNYAEDRLYWSKWLNVIRTIKHPSSTWMAIAGLFFWEF